MKSASYVRNTPIQSVSQLLLCMEQRHTHATLLIENGANMKAIQERLGHASFQETMDTYSHVTPKMEDDIVERIAKIF
ncbi:tyrosine-type recombinase/integrase [Veillonella parvula]|uniref:tyrosine-type recombinase/integrase n=1 Tax=Veillonella parvula TaxID=29466 RepID=UPI003119809B